MTNIQSNDLSILRLEYRNCLFSSN